MANSDQLFDGIAMNELFANYNYNEDSPSLKNLPYKNVSINPPAGDPISQIDLIKRSVMEAGGVSKMGGTMRPFSELTSDRYKFFVPGDWDNEDAYARGQHWSSKMVNGVGKGVIKAGTTFLQNTAGLVNGTFQWINTGQASSFYNNDFNKTLDEFNKNAENWMPNYYTNVEKNARWYSPKKLITANFFWDGIVKNLGFSVGTIFSGGVFTKALSSIPLTARLFTVKKAAETLAATERAALGGANAARTYGAVKKLSDKFLSSYNVLNPAGRATVIGLSTTGEAGFEAFHNLNEWRDNKIEEYKMLYGIEPTGSDLEQINKIADQVGNFSALLNIGILSATNYIQFPRLLGSTYKGEKAMINSLSRETRGIVKEGGKFVAKKPFYARGRILGTINGLRKYTFSASEAFEEGMQASIQNFTDDYFSKKYNNDPTRNILESALAGIKETLTTDEGMEEILIGGLSGAIMLGKSRFTQARDIKRNTALAVESFNKFRLSNFTKETMDAVNRGTTLQQEREQYIESGNIIDTKDAEFDYIINYLTPRIKYGRFDLVMAEINDYKQLASSQEGFNQLVEQGVALETDTREAFFNRVVQLESAANNVLSLYQSLQLRYGNLVTDDGKRLFDDEVMNRLVYTASKIADYDNRLPMVRTELINAGITNADQIATDIVNNKVESYEKAIQDINSNENITSTQKEEVTQNLNDFLELSLRRAGFVKEYDKIKSTPENYKAKEEYFETDMDDEEASPKETITVKTKKGEQDIELNTPYFVGRVVEYDKDGNEVYRAPVIEVLGQNEDNTIKIKNDKGEVSDVSPSVLEDYNLGKVSETKKNKKAMFFMKMWNVMFDHQGIKDKNGVPVRGRLEYSPKKDTLIFKYKDDNGNLREREVINTMLVPKEGVQYSMIKPSVALSAAQKKALYEFAKSKTTMSEQLRVRNSVITDLYNSTKEKLDKISAKLESNTKRVNDTVAKVKELTTTKDGKQKKRFTAVIRKSIADLGKLREDLEIENSELEIQKGELENNLALFQDFLNNKDLLPDTIEDVLEILKEDIKILSQSIDVTEDAIKSNNSLIDVVNENIQSALGALSSYIKNLKRKNPNIPFTLDKLQEHLDRYLSDKNNEEFMNERTALLDEILQLEGDVADFLSELNFPELAESFKSFPQNLEDLQQGLSDLKKEHSAMQEVFDAFEKAAIKEAEKAEQLERISKNDKLVDELIGTQEDSQPTVPVDDTYEADAKKATEIIPIATIGIDDGKAHQERANRFGFNLPKFDDDVRNTIRGVYVTINTEAEIGMSGLMERLATDASGNINAKVDQNRIIAMVMVIEEDGVFKPVDVNGEVIKEGKSLLDEGIYQVMPLETLTWANGESMFRSGTSKDAKTSISKQYAEWRTNTLKETEISIAHEISASFGRVEKVRDADGKIVPNSNVSATEAGFITEDGMAAGQVIQIPVTNDTFSIGITSYNRAMGMPMLQTGNGAVPLHNRKLTEKEANTVYSAILQLAKNILDPNIGVEGSAHLLNYLRSTVYWGRPKNKVSRNSVFFDVNEETGNLMLFISGKKPFVNFTPLDIEVNKEEIIFLLQELYNNVNLTNVRKVGEPYSEITDINEKGEVKTTTWKNYQSYLLSNKTPDGKSRKDIPLTVMARPLKTSDDVNRKDIYFFRTNTENEFVVPVAVKKSSIAPGKTNASQQKPKTREVVSRGQFKRGEGFINRYISRDGREIWFTVMDDATGPEGIIYYPDKGDGGEITTSLTKKGIDPVATIKTILYEYVKEQESQSNVAYVPDGVGESTLAFGKSEGSPQEDVTQEEAPSSTPSISAREALRRRAGKGNIPLRKALIKKLNSIKREDWGKVEKWLKKNVPNLPLYRVKNVMMATNGRMAWGAFKDGALYVYQNAEVGTTYHEVFHAIWRMSTSINERVNILNEFRNRDGQFIDRESGETLDYKDATDKQIEEQLAEEFRDYVQFKTIPKKPKSGKPFILRLFADLVTFIRNLIFGREAQSKVEQLFKDINTGRHRNVSPLVGSLENALNQINDIDSVDLNDEFVYRQPLVGITDKQRQDIIEHLTYLTITNITASDQNLFTIEKLNKDVLYNILKQQLIDNINETNILANELIEEGYSEADVQSIIDQNNALIESIESQWNQIAEVHNEYLASYNIKFDENNELQYKDEDKIKESNYSDATKIDTIRRANSAVKLLLSSIPKVDDSGEIVASESIGGVNLLPMSKVFITLLNKLHTSRGLDDMMSRLRNLAKEDPHYRALYSRIAKQSYLEDSVDFSNIKEQHGAQLLGAIWQTFKKQNPDVKNVFVLENGETVIADANLSDAANQLRDDFINQMILKAKKGSRYFMYDKDKKAYVPNIANLNMVNLANNTLMSNFLHEIGIQFSVEEMKKVDGQKLAEVVRGIKKSLIDGKAVITVNTRTLNMAGRLLQLGAFKHMASSPEFESTFFNVEGERSQAFIGTNTPSDLHDFLKSLKKFTISAVKDSEFRHLVTDSFSKGSIILNKMYTENGTPVKDSSIENLLKVGWVSGINNQDSGRRTVSAKLNIRDRFAQELSLNNDGWYLILVPGDSSTEWMIYIGNHISKSDIASNMESLHRIFEEYFKAEVKLASENRAVAKGRNSKDLRFFKAILGDKLHDEVMRNKTKTYNSKVRKAVEEFVKNEAIALQEVLENYDLLKKDLDGKINLDRVASPQNMTQRQLEQHLQFLAANYIVANIEFHKLLYGDPFLYSDELKRIKSSLSPRQSLIHNSPKTLSLFQRVYNKDFKENHVGWTNFTKPYFKTATLKDVFGIIDLPNFKVYKETDGAGIISFKAYRRLRILAGMWSDVEESQYVHDIEFEAMREAGASYEQLMEFNKNNPRIKSAYTPLKPIVFGNRLDNNGDFNNDNDVVLDKYSLYPLSSRVMFDINSDSNALKLYDKMVKEDIDYVIFETGRKVGAHATSQVYNDDDGSFNTEPFGESVINIPYSSIAIQAEVPSKDSNLVTRGSQITQLATSDFMDAGVPIDFIIRDKKGEPIEDFDKRFEQWNELSKEQKLEESSLYKEIQKNQELLEHIVDKGYTELLYKLGIRETKKGYEIVDRHKAGRTLKQELIKREVSDNMIYAIEDFINGNVILEATPAYHQIRNILYSIVDKSIASRKMTGGQKVQIPSTFFESNRASLKQIEGKSGYTSDVLKFYEKDGENVMEVMVGRWFSSEMTDDQLLEYFNNTEEGQQILRGIAFRIPTQQQNSVDVIKIKSFLPAEFGDSVVVPAALVEKAGSDFDIDKLFMYFKNVYIDKEGKPRLVTLQADENSTVLQRYRKYIRDAVDNFKFMKKQHEESDDRQQLNIELEENFQAYLSELEEFQGETYGPYINKINDIKRSINENSDSAQHIYDLGKLLFKELPESVRQYFYDRNDQMDKMVKSNDMLSFEKTLGFKALAHEWVNLIESRKETTIYYTDNKGKDVSETINKRETLNKLKLLISNYELYLNAIGWNAEVIQEFNNALDGIIEGKEEYLELKAYQKEDLKADNKKAFEKFNNLLYDSLVEMFNLPSIEEFSNLPIEQQNSIEALENEYVQSLQNLIGHPLNRENLLSPNSAKPLEDLAKEIAELTVGKTFDYTDVGNLVRRKFMTEIRHAFVSGKYAIGISARSQVNNTINQRQPIYIDPSRIDRIKEEDKQWIGDAVIRFKDYNKMTISGKVYATMSKVYNTAGNRITNIIAQFIDGYVDISKGPWIMQLGATKNVAGTFLFLIKIGVPVRDVAYFMNQPIIREYLKRIENSGYSWLYITDIIDEVNDMYSDGFSEKEFNQASSRFIIPDAKDLKENIGKNETQLDKYQRFRQRLMLKEFLKYAKMANHSFKIDQATNFDTANFNDPLLIIKKDELLKEARQTIISDVDDMLENSYLKKLQEKFNSSMDAMSKILTSQNPKVRNVVRRTLLPYINLPDREFVKLGRKVVSDLFDWAVQVDQDFNAHINNIMIKDGGAALEIMDFVNSVKNDDTHPLYGNVVIDSITAVPSRRADEGVVNNLKIKNLQNKVYEQNSIIHSFRQIREYLKGENDLLYRKIVTLAVLQSGITNSSISFTNLLPYEDFEKIYNKTLPNLEMFPDLNSYHELGVFQRNNWDNSDIVPYKKAMLRFSKASGKPMYNLEMSFREHHINSAISSGKVPNLVKLATSSREAFSDFIVFSWEKQVDLLTEKEIREARRTNTPMFIAVKEKKAKMREVGDYSYINKGLFQKVYDPSLGKPLSTGYTNRSGVFVEQHVYKMINAWGDAYRANEFYNVEKRSVINNGFLKVESGINDVIIVDLFAGKASEKAARKATTRTKITPLKPSLPSTANFQVESYIPDGEFYNVIVDNKGKRSTFVLDESGVVEGRDKERNELKELYRRLRAHDKPNEVKPDGLPPIPRGPEKC